MQGVHSATAGHIGVVAFAALIVVAALAGIAGGAGIVRLTQSHK